MIRIIVAVDQKNGIGKKGFQPWYIPEDDAYFSRQTKLYGAKILVGNTTYKTFTRPQGGRTNYVLSRSTQSIGGAIAINDLNAFLDEMAGQDLWVVGGASIFEQVLNSNKADELYITHIEADFDCDQFFPDYSADFSLREKSEQREQNGFKFSYAIYDRSQRSAAEIT